MTAPERHLPTATTRAIVRENLTEHLVQASSRALSGDGGLSRRAAEGIVSELLDVAFRIEHQPRGDRIRVTLNPPQVGTPLPVADGREHVVEAGGWTTGPTDEQRQQDYAQQIVSAGSGRAQLDQIAGEVTADGSTVILPSDLGGNATPEPPYPGMVSDGRGNWYSPEEAAARGVTTVTPTAVELVDAHDQAQANAVGDETGPQCDAWSSGVRCRFRVNKATGQHEGDHTFGGGMGDPVDLKHCGEPEAHLAHAWRPKADGPEVHGCSGKPLTERTADVVLTGPEGIGSDDDGVDFTEDQGDSDPERAAVPPADFE